jgi:nucleoside-diphosphate-sugar epimerase
VSRDFVDVELRVPAVIKARDLLGFEAKIDLDEGICRTAEYYRAQITSPAALGPAMPSVGEPVL